MHITRSSTLFVALCFLVGSCLVLKSIIFYWAKKGTCENNFIPKKLKKIFKNLTLVVIRKSKKNCCEKEFTQSKPCNNCIGLIQMLGIKKILYTNENGEIIYEKSNRIVKTHCCKSQQR